MRGRSALLALASIVAGCARDRPAGAAFERLPDAKPTMTILLRAASDTSVPGWPGVELDLLLPSAVTEPAARATLQHAIDSVAAADSAVRFVRVTGFRMGRVNPDGREAPIDPVIRAVWGPADTAAFGARQRRSVYRTHFVSLVELPGDTAAAER